MKYTIVKNKRLYKSFLKLELKIMCYKSLFFNRSLPHYLRQSAFNKLLSLNSFSYVNTKRGCNITHNTRSVSNHFKISRIKLRLLKFFLYSFS